MPFLKVYRHKGEPTTPNDGIVDAADYVIWRKTGGSPDDYNAWQTNFGQPGSGAAAPSADSQPSANVPEACSYVLAALSAIGLGFHRWRIGSPTSHEARARQ